MYAIVKTGGKQYRVEQGQTPARRASAASRGRRRDARAAAVPLATRSSSTPADSPDVKVTATIVGHVRGEKLRVFKFKPKRGYKRRTGHRQDLTRIEVTEIGAAASAREAARRSPPPRNPRPRTRVRDGCTRESRVRESRGRDRKPPAAKASTAKPAGASQSARETAGNRRRRNPRETEGGAVRWRIRRASARAATGATPTRSASA